MPKRKMPRSPGPYSVKLSPYESEIMELHLQGKRVMDILRWLKTEKKVTIAYSNLHSFIRLRAEKYAATTGTSVVVQFMHLKPEIKEEVLEILLELMGRKASKSIHHSSPPKMNRNPEKEAKKEGDVFDYMKIKPGDSPAQIRLKKFAALDSTDLDHIPEELMKPLNGKDNSKNKK